MNMTVTRKVEQELRVKAIRIKVPVNYEEEDMPNDYPHRKGDLWDITVDIESGQIRDWPHGVVPRNLYMKVVDGGIYSLLQDGDWMKPVAEIDQDYVPRCIPGQFGDYIDFKVDANGIIANWKTKCTPDRVAESFFPDED